MGLPSYKLPAKISVASLPNKIDMWSLIYNIGDTHMHVDFKF